MTRALSLGLLIFLCLIRQNGCAQNAASFAEKLSVSADKFVSSTEQPLLLPRGFLYDLQKPDSVLYLSCIGSDQKDFRAFLDNQPAIVLPVPGSILRGAGEVVDTIRTEPVDKLITGFKTVSGTEVRINAGTRYLLIYYVSQGTIEDLRKNIRYFERFIRKHPDLHIQSIYPIVVF